MGEGQLRPSRLQVEQGEDVFASEGRRCGTVAADDRLGEVSFAFLHRHDLFLDRTLRDELEH